MKIALCLSGHARTYEHTAASWEPLRSQHEVTVFAHLWDVTDFSGPTWWGESRASHPLCEDSFRSSWRPDELTVHSSSEVPVRDYGNLARTSRVKPMDCEMAYWLMRQCILSCQGTFDIVLRSRPDVELHAFTPRHVASNELVCCGRDTLCDIHFYGSHEAMNTASLIVDEFPACASWTGHDLRPESMLAKHCQRRGLEISHDNISFSLIRTSGIPMVIC